MMISAIFPRKVVDEFGHAKPSASMQAEPTQATEVRPVKSGLFTPAVVPAAVLGFALLFRGDGLLFGPETRGLPGELLSELSPNVLRIPMRGDSRSLNLSNAVAIVVFEALRQTGFENLA